MPRLFCIIVIYNSDLSKSVAYNNILKANLKFCQTIVVDNSVNIDNSGVCQNNKNVVLIQNRKNLGLTKGINQGLDYVASQNPDDDDIVVLLNDDTSVNREFFLLLLDSISKGNSDIYVPVMQGQNGVYYSPCRQGFFKNHYIKSADEIVPQSRFMAIMSGTAASWAIFCDYRFDENIFMDLLDNDFCDFQRAKGRKFETMGIVIQQNLALKNKGLTYERIQKRYKIWIPDFLVYCKKKPVRLWGFLPAVFARGIMFSYKCKNLKFLLWSVGYAFECMVKGDVK